MAKYKNHHTQKAVEGLRSFYALVESLRTEQEYVSGRYKGVALDEKNDDIRRRYNAAAEAVRGLVVKAIEDAHAREYKRLGDQVTADAASPDFAVLQLPVTVTADELRLLLERNKGNMLFTRAAGEFAVAHGYDAAHVGLPAHAAAATVTYTEQSKLLHSEIDSAGQRLLNMCEQPTIDAAHRLAKSFAAYEAAGIFENL